MIHLKDVSKKYDNGVVAIEDVGLRIEQGEFVYLIGPSGSGKSTLMKLLYREEIADKGQIIVGKYLVTQLKDKQVPTLRRSLGIIFQDFKLLPKLTVFENVAYALEVIGKSKKEIKDRVTEVLALVDLRVHRDQYPDQLSGGEQQRVSIARAIVNHPQILIADEPTGNLDPDNALEILKLLEKINRRGTTVLMGTHNDQLVNQHRHRVIRLEHGKLVSDVDKGDYHD